MLAYYDSFDFRLIDKENKSHDIGPPCFLPQSSAVTILAELHARLTVEPHCLDKPANRGIPDICSHPTAPGDLHGSVQ